MLSRVCIIRSNVTEYPTDAVMWKVFNETRMCRHRRRRTVDNTQSRVAASTMDQRSADDAFCNHIIVAWAMSRLRIVCAERWGKRGAGGMVPFAFRFEHIAPQLLYRRGRRRCFHIYI